MKQIPAPWAPDPYERQQALEMRFCEKCQYQMTCPVYGRPYCNECQDLQLEKE